MDDSLSYPSFELNFKLLNHVVSETSLTEKVTHRQTDTHIVTEKAKTIYRYTSYSGGITTVQLENFP